MPEVFAMPVQAHLFIIDPLVRLNLKLDSTLRLAFHLCQRGHRVYTTQGDRLSWSNKDGVVCSSTPLTFPHHDPERPALGLSDQLSLTAFQAVHMRKDPPFDLEYLYITQMLDLVATKVRVYNEPRALREVNEKLSILRFPEFSRMALVSSAAQDLLAFIRRECESDGIIKPLDLYGGRGVRRLDFTKTSDTDALVILRDETVNGTKFRLVQAFDSHIFQGEVRAFAAFGKPVAWCLKQPKKGEYLANTAAGAELHPYNPSKSEIDTVQNLASRLLRQGVFFVGFDLIDGYVSEMNITSPRLLAPAGQDNDFYGLIADEITADCSRFRARV